MTLWKRLEQAILLPFLDRQGVRKLATGAILSLVPVFAFFSFGYVLALFQARLEGSRSWRMPPWTGLDLLFHRGLLFFLVGLTYCFPAYVLTSVAFNLLRFSFAFFFPSLFLLAVSALLWLLAIFILPMAMASFLRRGHLRAIFDLEEIYARTSTILPHYLPAALAALAAIILLSLPLLLTRYGYLVSLPGLFLVMALLGVVFGDICREAYT